MTDRRLSLSLPVAVAWHFSKSVAIRHVLPVLRMTSLFSYNGPMARHVYSKEHDQYNSRDCNQILLNDKDQQVLIVNCNQGEVCYLRLPCLLVFLLLRSQKKKKCC